MTGKGEEAILTLRDLLDLKLDGIRLAILSACETGLAGTKLADEVISLPTGLLQAGVAGVVASLWSVSELSTMVLLKGSNKPPGPISEISAPEFKCPKCDYTWSRDRIGRPTPLCPTHNVPLEPAF